MNELDVVQMQERMASCGIKDMEQYRECISEISACNYVFVELSEMLEKQEQRNA